MTPIPQLSGPSFRPIVVLAAWFGLVTGLVEGIGLLALQKLRWLSWDMSQMAVSLEIIWISALFDLLLFTCVGVLLAAAAQVIPRLPWLRLVVFAFALLAFLDWLLLSGRIRHSGALVLALGLATVLTRWFTRHVEAGVLFARKTLPLVAALALFALVGIQVGLWLRERWATARLPAPSPGSPNILVIVVDTLRADHLSTCGYARPTSPNLDRIAQQGVLFENAFATSSWTLPSHASLLTGRYPYQHGAELDSLDTRSRTIAEALRSRGYRTAAFSANNLWFCRRRGFGRGFIRFEDYFDSIADMAARTLYGRKFDWFVLGRLGYENIPGRKLASDINRSVLRWIDRDPNKPFFAFLNYFDVHDPYLPPQPYRSKFAKLPNPGGILNTWVFRYYPKMTSEELQGEVDAYDGAIAYVDHHIGQLLAELEKRGLGKNTLVVITSDHGESFGEHGLLLHINALYLELIRVPLIFWQPERVPQGVRVSQPVSIAALPATLMQLLGQYDQTIFPGPSLVQLWKAPGQPDWRYPLAELAQFQVEVAKKNPSYHGALKSLVSPEWHYIVHQKFSTELYAWQRDSQELNNLANTPEGQRIAADFARRLQALLAQSPEDKPGRTPPGM